MDSNLHTLELQLVNSKNYALGVSLFKGVNYVCLPAMDCVDVQDMGGVGYGFILTDLVAHDILIYKIKVIFSGNSNQSRYSFRERFQSSTGTEVARNINVQSYISPQQSDNTIVEINLKRPIKVGGKRFLDYTVDKNTTMTVVFSFKYASEDKNKQYKNFVDEKTKEIEENERQYNAYLTGGFSGKKFL